MVDVPRVCEAMHRDLFASVVRGDNYCLIHDPCYLLLLAMCNGNAALAAYMIVTQLPYTFYSCDFYKDDLMKMISEGCKSLLFLNVSYTSITDGSCRLIAK